MKIRRSLASAMFAISFATTLCAADVKPYTLNKCFMSGHEFDQDSVEFDYAGRHIKLCCKDCEADFKKAPEKFLAKLDLAEKAGGGMKNVDAEQFAKLRDEKQNVVLDVRTAKEYEAGHIPGAVNIDLNGPDFEKKVSALDKKKTYLVHCAGGVRSVKACKKMETLDFKSLYNLEGGMKAWEKAGKPVEK